MIDSSPSDRDIAKQVMLTYISALGPGASHLFRKDRNSPSQQNFEDVWETILKTVSDHS